MGLVYKSFLSTDFEEAFKKVGSFLEELKDKLSFIRTKMEIEKEKTIFQELAKDLSAKYIAEVKELTDTEKADLGLAYQIKKVALENMESSLKPQLEWKVVSNMALTANEFYSIMPIIIDPPV